MPNTATEKQISFINSLKAQREAKPQGLAAMTISRELWHREQFITQAASALIDVLKALPYRSKSESVSVAPSVAPEGMHRMAGVIYKVQKSPDTGRAYAKRLEQEGDEWKFVYAPGAIRNLSEDTKMSLEQAKDFGVLYGTCCVCGRTLTNEDSIAAGIGPVCAGKF